MLVVSVCRALHRSLARNPGSAVVRDRASSAVRPRSLHTTSVSRSAGQESQSSSRPFDTEVLQFLVCPLSRKALRYDESTNELINDELGIAYPIVEGIPNMIPQDARMIHKDRKSKEVENTSE